MSPCTHPPICGYGYFPGGDPREFSPDEESCSAQDEGHSGLFVALGNGAAAIMCGHRFGIGTYTVPCDCDGEECEHADAYDSAAMDEKRFQTCNDCGSSREVYADDSVGEWRAP